MDGLRLIYIITGEVYMQHGTKNGYVGILFWLEPGAKITCNMVGFFWDRRSHSLLCRTIHALGLYRIHSSVKAKAGLGLGLELPVGERFYVVVCFLVIAHLPPQCQAHPSTGIARGSGAQQPGFTTEGVNCQLPSLYFGQEDAARRRA
jgi:hypothetical protein